MGPFEYVVIFVISWWMLLFMVLPFKAQPAESPELTEYHAAPKKAYLKIKIVITTILAFLATMLLSWLFNSGLIHTWLPYQF